MFRHSLLWYRVMGQCCEARTMGERSNVERNRVFIFRTKQVISRPNLGSSCWWVEMVKPTWKCQQRTRRITDAVNCLQNFPSYQADFGPSIIYNDVKTPERIGSSVGGKGPRAYLSLNYKQRRINIGQLYLWSQRQPDKFSSFLDPPYCFKNESFRRMDDQTDLLLFVNDAITRPMLQGQWSNSRILNIIRLRSRPYRLVLYIGKHLWIYGSWCAV